MTNTPSKPLAAFRFGDVSAAIFADDVALPDCRMKTVYHTCLRRSYRRSDGTWKATSSLRVDDLLPASYALLKCAEVLSKEL